MNDRTMPGLAAVSLGVLIVVLSRALDLEGPWRLVMSISGAVLAVVGVVMMWRARTGEDRADE